MKQIIENLELIQLQINKLVEEKGIFVLGNPFLKALLDTTIEDLKNLQIKELAKFYGIETDDSGAHTVDGEPLTPDNFSKAFGIPRPFDKLKRLWNEWKEHNSLNLSFTEWIALNYMHIHFYKETKEQTVHQWLAEHCGFLTTAEVRQAIQELKSSEVIYKSSDDMRNEDY